MKLNKVYLSLLSSHISPFHLSMIYFYSYSASIKYFRGCEKKKPKFFYSIISFWFAEREKIGIFLFNGHTHWRLIILEHSFYKINFFFAGVGLKIGHEIFKSWHFK